MFSYTKQKRPSNSTTMPRIRDIGDQNILQEKGWLDRMIYPAFLLSSGGLIVSSQNVQTAEEGFRGSRTGNHPVLSRRIACRHPYQYPPKRRRSVI